MCFSASASFIAGGSLGTAGLFTIRRANEVSRIPLASIPLLFGIQQAIEGVVWISVDRPYLNAFSTYAYVFFSHVFWPAFTPFAVMLIERDPRRRLILKGLLVFGLAVSLYLLAAVLRGPVTSSPSSFGIIYDFPLPETPVLLAAYLAATCASCLVSSHKLIRARSRRLWRPRHRALDVSPVILFRLVLLRRHPLLHHLRPPRNEGACAGQSLFPSTTTLKPA